MNLQNRIDKLTAQFLPPPLRQVQLDPERLALARELIDRRLADPERRASQIATLEKCKERLEQEGPWR